MEKESLDKASVEIMKTIKNLDINGFDKIELMINLSCLLDKENYDEGIKVLRLSKKK